LTDVVFLSFLRPRMRGWGRWIAPQARDGWGSSVELLTTLNLHALLRGAAPFVALARATSPTFASLRSGEGG